VTGLPPPRRRLLGLAAGSALLAACQPLLERPEQGPLAGVFPGQATAPGFAAMGHAGLQSIREQLRMPVTVIEGAGTTDDARLHALRGVARSEATLLVVFDETAGEAVQRVAWEFPDKRFACPQGTHLRPNVAIYEARGEQSAWLAGVAAALLSSSGVIGHVSGKPRPSLLRVRAGFADGLRAERPSIRLLTHFTGQDADRARTREAVRAMIDAGADTVFLTPEADWTDALPLARSRGVRVLGQGPDWLALDPAHFIGAAVEDIGALTLAMGRDLHDAIWPGDTTRRYVLRHPHIVRFTIAEQAPRPLRSRIAELRGRMAAGQVNVAGEYVGPEFTP